MSYAWELYGNSYGLEYLPACARCGSYTFIKRLKRCLACGYRSGDPSDEYRTRRRQRGALRTFIDRWIDRDMESTRRVDSALTKAIGRRKLVKPRKPGRPKKRGRPKLRKRTRPMAPVASVEPTAPRCVRRLVAHQPVALVFLPVLRVSTSNQPHSHA